MGGQIVVKPLMPIKLIIHVSLILIYWYIKWCLTCNALEWHIIMSWRWQIKFWRYEVTKFLVFSTVTSGFINIRVELVNSELKQGVVKRFGESFIFCSVNVLGM